MTPQQAALAVGVTAALATLIFKGPIWAAILAGSAGAVVTQKAIGSA